MQQITDSQDKIEKQKQKIKKNYKDFTYRRVERFNLPLLQLVELLDKMSTRMVICGGACL